MKVSQCNTEICLQSTPIATSAAVKSNLAKNQMDIKVGLLEPQQETTLPPEELCSREERRQQAERIQRKKELDVNNAFRAENIKNYLSQWSSITSHP